MSYFPSLEDILDGVADVLLFIPRKIYELAVDGIESLLDADFFKKDCSNVPDTFLCNPEDPIIDPIFHIQAMFDFIPDQGIYLFYKFNVDTGLTMVTATFLFLYVWNRIPFLGGR